jgi:AcrR family transcriptional regulator
MEEIDIKGKILKGADELFTKYGVRSISMDDIARHLTVSKKTLYQHFADKEDIVTLACKTHIDRHVVEFEEIRNTAENAIDELGEVIDESEAQHAEHESFAVVRSSEIPSESMGRVGEP